MRADVVARLLGLRILKLRADVVVVPATTLVRGQAPRLDVTPSRVVSHHPPGTLAQARRLLNESDGLLDRVALEDGSGPQ